MSRTSSNPGFLALALGILLCLVFLGGGAALIARDHTAAGIFFLLAALAVGIILLNARRLSESLYAEEAPRAATLLASPEPAPAKPAAVAPAAVVPAEEAAEPEETAEPEEATEPEEAAEPEEAPQPAALMSSPPAPSEPVKPDDMKKVEGIGPKIAGLLQAAGIATFAQLAEADMDRLRKVLEDAGPRFRLADPATWPEQAALAAAGNWDQLDKLQDDLKGGRRA